MVDWSFEIRWRSAEEGRYLEIVGELDAHTLDGLLGMLGPLDGAAPVQLDLSRLRFADAAAALELGRLRLGGKVRLTGASSRLRRVFALLGLEHALEEPAPRRNHWSPRQEGLGVACPTA